MDTWAYILFGVLVYSKIVLCEYCQIYVDSHNNTHRGFNCPPALRLVGKSAFYCCVNDSKHYCCNDRRKSLYHSDRTYGEEAFILYWPFLALGALVAGFVVIIPYTMPKNAEVKQEKPIDC